MVPIVAHQRKIAGLGTNWMFETAKKGNGKLPKTINIMMNFMGPKAEVILCCGSKGPYAKKSHKILMKYLKNVREIILEGYRYGHMMYFQGDKLSKMIIKEWETNQ